MYTLGSSDGSDMSEAVADSYRRALEELVRLDSSAASQPSMDEEIRSIRDGLLREVAIFLSDWTQALADHLGPHWQADASNPGYLYGDLAGTRLHVPFNLALGLPRHDELQELLALAQRFSGSSSSTVCLSGSAMLSVQGAEPGDLDFCEYLGWHPSELAGVLASATRSSDNCQWMDLMVWRGRSGRREISRICTDEELRVFFQAAKLSDGAMCRAVAQTESWGVIEATKLVLPRHVQRFSYSPQEVPAVEPAGWVPRSLLEASGLVDYASFLFSQVEKLLSSNPAKAARRILALARVMLWREIADDASAFLRGLRIKTYVPSRLDLLERLAVLDVPEFAHYRANLAAHLTNVLWPGEPARKFEVEAARAMTQPTILELRTLNRLMTEVNRNWRLAN